ncbi:MAG: hypothetical protein RL020_446 [Pseudomonadota bacterium]
MTEIISFDGKLPEPEVDFPKPERLVKGNPRRTTWNLFTNASGEINSGIWECEVGAWKIFMGPTEDEFFHVISGKARLHVDDKVTEINAGESAIIPAGTQAIFEVVEHVKKHYVIVERKV